MAHGTPDDLDVGAVATPYKKISAASTNSTLVQAGVVLVTWYYITNLNTSYRFVKLYDKASAPTVGTDTPKVTLGIPGASSANVAFRNPLEFELGLGLGMTTGIGDSNTGAVAADEIVANLGYIAG